MDRVLNWFTNNYQWFFSGLGAALIGWLASLIVKRYKNKEVQTPPIAPVMQQKQEVVVNLPKEEDKKGTQQKIVSSGDVKARTHILFIDDEDFAVVKSLKSAGWGNTKLKRKIANVDDPAIMDAHIVFVDIVGVCGDLFKDEGLGLARALKEKYPEKKIIIYSGESQGDRFDKTLRMVDECLPKNAEVYEFLSLVDQFANEIWKND